MASLPDAPSEVRWITIALDLGAGERVPNIAKVVARQRHIGAADILLQAM
jgi:hypothetical protein